MKRLMIVGVLALAALTGCGGSVGSSDSTDSSGGDQASYYEKINVGGVTCIVAKGEYIITCDWDSYNGSVSGDGQ